MNAIIQLTYENLLRQGMNLGFSVRTHELNWVYVAAVNAIERCRNPNNASYPDYGGRGISFLFESPTAFVLYCIAEGLILPWMQKGEVTLDRIDNNGNYEPGNIRFVPRIKNNLNRRNTSKIVYLGQETTCSELAQKHKHPYKRIAYRLRAGWEVSSILTHELGGKPMRQMLKLNALIRKHIQDEIISVSKDGRVVDLTRNVPLYPSQNNEGYLKIKIKGEWFSMHRVVAIAHVHNKNSSEDIIVHHKDGIRSNNHASNLEWVTHQENAQQRHTKNPEYESESTGRDIFADYYANTASYDDCLPRLHNIKDAIRVYTDSPPPRNRNSKILHEMVSAVIGNTWYPARWGMALSKVDLGRIIEQVLLAPDNRIDLRMHKKPPLVTIVDTKGRNCRIRFDAISNVHRIYIGCQKCGYQRYNRAEVRDCVLDRRGRLSAAARDAKEAICPCGSIALQYPHADLYRRNNPDTGAMRHGLNVTVGSNIREWWYCWECGDETNSVISPKKIVGAGRRQLPPLCPRCDAARRLANFNAAVV